MNPYLFPYMMTLPVTPLDDRPPTLYVLMNSLANYDKEDKIKIQDLPSATHKQIFNFDYPLSNKINKDEFEIMILNKFIMRRINFETFTSFQIALNVKLNEIMPTYNKMFDFLEGWDLFNSGEEVTREVNDTRDINSTSNIVANGNSTTDNRFSDLPQSQIDNVKDAKYLSEYTYNTSSDSNTSNGTSTSNDTGKLTETINRTPGDKVKIYTEFMQNKKNIYSLIFNDLDILFFQLF